MTRPTQPNFLEIELGGETLRCSFDYSPGTPDVMYLSNGDPGYPGDPEEFSVTKIELLVLAATEFAPALWRDITDLLFDATSDEGERINDLAYAALLSEQASQADEPPPGYDYEPD
tara:strand:+ start:696 stop:1043 length:348 start_codon:yes stop_codon:yes gene_type:complete